MSRPPIAAQIDSESQCSHDSSDSLQQPLGLDPQSYTFISNIKIWHVLVVASLLILVCVYVPRAKTVFKNREGQLTNLPKSDYLGGSISANSTTLRNKTTVEIAEILKQTKLHSCPNCADIYIRLEKIERTFDCWRFKCCIDLVMQNWISEMIELAIRKYDADNTGRVDFAMHSSGGRVLSSSPACVETASLEESSQAVIQPGNLPGECWLMKSDHGHVVIKLQTTIILTDVSIEVGDSQTLKSAPASISLYVMDHSEDPQPIHVADCKFSIDMSSPSIQYCRVEGEPVADIVKVEIRENHGNHEFTGLCRIRVHGRPN